MNKKNNDLEKPFMINPRFARDRAGKDIHVRNLKMLDDVFPRGEMEPKVQILDLDIRREKYQTEQNADGKPAGYLR